MKYGIFALYMSFVKLNQADILAGHHIVPGSLSRSHERSLRASCPGVWKGFHGWKKFIEANESTTSSASLIDGQLSMRKVPKEALFCLR